jgi:hypothetical protein
MTTSTTPIIAAHKLDIYVSQLENQMQSETRKITSLKQENEAIFNENIGYKKKLLDYEQCIATMRQEANNTRIANTTQTDELKLAISQLILENVRLESTSSVPEKHRPRTTPRKVFKIIDTSL